MKKYLQFILCILIPVSEAAQPISLHPMNPHYFLFREKPLAIISSSEHYGAVLNPDFDMIRYLDTLQEEGMTYTRVFTGTYFEKEGSFGIEKNTLAPAAGKALLPWKRSHQPGAASGGNKFDLNKWDEKYFNRLKTFVSEAGKRGIIVEITLFSSIYGYWDIQAWNRKNNVTIKENIGKKSIQTLRNGIALKYQENVVRKIVRELNGFDNIIYEIQNEPWADHKVRFEANREYHKDTELDGRDWQENVYIANHQSLEWQKKIASTIVEEEKKLRNKHLIAQNYSNFYYRVPRVNPDVSLLNFHYAYPLAVEKNYAHRKVIGFDETGFAGSADVTYRKQAWKFIIAGGGLYNNLDYSFTVGNEDGTAVNNAPGGGGAELRKQLKVLSDFFHSFDFISMSPKNKVVLKASEASARVLAEKGRQYAVYIYDGTRCILNLDIPEGQYIATWISTVDGNVMHSKIFNHAGGEVTLTSPEFSEDIALKILAQEESI